MPVTTVFRDKLPRGVSFPLGAVVLDEILGSTDAAVYFVNASTWVRQAAPLDHPELPEDAGTRVGASVVFSTADSKVTTAFTLPDWW